MAWVDDGAGNWRWDAVGGSRGGITPMPSYPPMSAMAQAAAASGASAPLARIGFSGALGTVPTAPTATPLATPGAGSAPRTALTALPMTAAQDAAALSALSSTPIAADPRTAAAPPAPYGGYAAGANIPAAPPATPPVDTTSLTPFAPTAPVATGAGRTPFGAAPPVGAQPPVTNANPNPTLQSYQTGLAGTANPFVAQPSGAQVAGADAPKVDTTAINAALAGVTGYQGQIGELANNDTAGQVALAQLASSSQQAQSAALGQARSGNIRDRAAAERGAVGEVAFTQQQSARDAALLTANEAEADRQFKLQALGKAADLGLNTSALQVDISKANLDSANNYLNQQFQQLGLNKQLSEDQAKNVLAFSQEMATLELQYDQLDEASKEAFYKNETERYGIDQQTATALQQIAEQKRENNKATGWGSFFKNLATGAVTGLTGAVTAKVLGK